MNSVTMTNNSGPIAPGASSPSTGRAPQQIAQPPTPSDAEVVSRVVSNSEIKPSNVSQSSQPTQEVIAKTAQQLQTFVQSMGRNLSFSVDGVTGYNVVRVVNPETGEVVRQLPSEELLKIAEAMQTINTSGLVNQKA